MSYQEFVEALRYFAADRQCGTEDDYELLCKVRTAATLNSNHQDKRVKLICRWIELCTANAVPIYVVANGSAETVYSEIQSVVDRICSDGYRAKINELPEIETKELKLTTPKGKPAKLADLYTFHKSQGTKAAESAATYYDSLGPKKKREYLSEYGGTKEEVVSAFVKRIRALTQAAKSQ